MAGSERRNNVVVVSMQSQPAGSERNASLCSLRGLGRNNRWKRGLAYRRTEETALCSTDHVRNGILFIGRGLAYRKTEETDFSWTSYGRNGVLLIGRGVAYCKTEKTDLCWSATVETGVLFIGRGVAYRKTGLHGILFISTIDLLQPPRATVHPPSTSSSLHLRLFIHGLLFIQPPPRAPPPATVQPALSTGVLFNHPSTGYYSSSPPPTTVQPALHGVLFIQPSTGSCSSTGSIDRGTVHPAATASTTTGSCSSNPHRELFIQTPQQRSLFIQRQHRSASVSSSSEGIARSGSVNSHRSIARVQ